MTPSTNPHHDRRWVILGLIGLAQLMVVLDVTIVNIALPSAQKALHFSNDNRQWIVTGYALAFGSLLLLGGRLSDFFGRKWTFFGGLIGFAVVSAIGGASQSFGMLVGARTLQGAFAAVLAPAALSLLTTTFTDPDERRKAFAVYGAIAGAGGAIGLLLGGVLTEYLSWRFSLYVNLVLAVPAAMGAVTLLHSVRPETKPRLDLRGTLLASSGLFSLVFGFTKAETDGWGAGVTVGFLAAAVVLLAGFVASQRRSEHPLLPLRVITDRDRGGAYMAVGIVGIGMFGAFLFLTYYLQTILGYTPLKTGLAFLPMIGTVMITAAVAQTRVLPRIGAKPLITLGMLLAAGGMALLTGVGVEPAYASHVLPGIIVMGMGLGMSMATAMSTATLGVSHRDQGVASAMVNTSQQVGGSIGTALLSTIAASATSSFAGAPAAAAVHGYTTAFWWSTGIFMLGAVVAGTLLRPGVAQFEQHATAEPVLA
jgi:EmrB/QacA subfamily drug resistance transporter